MRFERDGTALWYGTSDAPAPVGRVEAGRGSEEGGFTIRVGVHPPSASNQVRVIYRVNGGDKKSIPATLLSHDLHQKAQYFVSRFPPFRVGDGVDYDVVLRIPGHQIPAAQPAGQFAASFHVVAAGSAEATSRAGSDSTAAHAQDEEDGEAKDKDREAADRRRSMEPESQDAHAAGASPDANPEARSRPSVTGASRRRSDAAMDAGAEADDAAKVLVASSLRRIPSAIDPLSDAGGKVGDKLLPLRTAAVSKFYLGIDRVRSHLQLVAGALAKRTLPAQLIGVLLQPSGVAGRLLQVQFDPLSVGSHSPKVTVVTHDTGSFQISLPHGATLPHSGLLLTVHGLNGSAHVTIPASQIATNGLFGSVTLPISLNPLSPSILIALDALLPARKPSSSPDQTSKTPHMHVVKLGEDDACQLSFNANNAVDKFPYGIFFRLVEPQTSIPHVARSLPGHHGFIPIPNYGGGHGSANGSESVAYVDRIPIEQPLSVDGFRDQIMGIDESGRVTAEETVSMAGTLGLGYVLWMSQSWTFQGLGLGDLVYSLPLAPGEQQQIAIYERVDTAEVSESEFFSEEQTEAQAAQSDTSTQATFNSAFNELVNGGSQFSANSTTSSSAGGGGLSLGIISFGGSGSSGSTSSSGQSSQWLQGQRNTTQQAAEGTHSAAENQAAARRSAAHTSMSMASASESELATTKIITNHNHTRALTLQYWEVQRLYDVRTAVDGLTLTCLVPMQVVRFLPPGQALTVSDTGMVKNRARVMARYSSLIKHADVLGRALPRRLQYGLTLLHQFAADPTAEVEPFGGVAEDVIQFSLSGTFLPCEDVHIIAVTKRNTRVGPVKLVSSDAIPLDAFASQDELLTWLSLIRQGISPTSLSGSLALPQSMNRNDIVGFELRRHFRQVDYTLLSPEQAAVNAFNASIGNQQPSFMDALIEASVGQTPNALVRATIHIAPHDLERSLGGPLLEHFQASIQEFDANGNLQSAAKGETYANDSLYGVELPPQPYPVPALQIAPVLRFNQILEIEKMAQHVVRNTIFYSKAIWASVSPDERAILLERYTIGVPSDGVSDESQTVPLLNCVENRVLGFFGNSMLMPFTIPQAVAEQMNIDPVQLQDALLAYQKEGFAPPQSTIALPTHGVLGEAVLGNCPSAEKIDLTRFWNWANSPADSAPAIAPVSLPTASPSIAAGLSAPNALTNLPSLINNVLTPPTPDTSLLQALSKSAASQQDFSPSLTGAQQLAGLLTNAQNTSNSARSDALKASNQLISQAMTTAASMLSSPMSGSASPSTTGQTQGTPSTQQTTPSQGQAQGQSQTGSSSLSQVASTAETVLPIAAALL